MAASKLFESPWGAALTSGIFYLIISAYFGELFQRSDHAYYNFLADSFLHGQTWLRQIPPSIKDLSIYNGKYYLYWPPFPAVLLMPFIAIFGVQFNDVVFTIIIGAVNVGLLAFLLRKATQVEFLHLTKFQRAVMVFFFGFGTVYFTQIPFGKVWMTAAVVGFMCVILSYIFAFSLNGGLAWLLSGLALSGAMLTRNTLLFTGIFPLVYLLYRQKPWEEKRLIRDLALGLLPIIIAGSLYLVYNQVRFGNPFETGYLYHNMNNFFRGDYERYGFFNVHFIPINLYYQYIAYPFPLRADTLMGGSLFLLSPLFFGVFSAFKKPHSKLLVYALLASILVTNVPIILLMGTGFIQFGPRYTIDFTVPLLLLTALGIEHWKPIVSFLLALISAVQYFIGINLLR